MSEEIEDMIIILSKYAFGIELFPDELIVLKEWLKGPADHQVFFSALTDVHWKDSFPEDLPADHTGTIERIRRAMYTMNGITAVKKQNPGHPEINNGSANAFEATENPVQYEDDVSDEDIDERI